MPSRSRSHERPRARPRVPSIPPPSNLAGAREIRLDGRRAIRVLDAAYRIDAPDDDWLAALDEAIAPALDTGQGVHAFDFDFRKGTLSNPRLSGGEADWVSSWREIWWDGLMASVDPSTVRALASFGPLSYTRDLFTAAANAVPTFELLLDSVGASLVEEGLPETVGRYPDSLNLVSHDVSGHGIGFCANRATRSSAPPSAASVELGGLLAAHFAAAIRLRTARREGATAVDSADVLFTDRGDVVNVREGAVLDARLDELRHAARTVVRSKKHAADDSDGRASLVLWQVLFAKSFSVVDVYERDGRRYLVANRNRPKPVGAIAGKLSPREHEVVALLARGHSNKLIAYELDIGTSTVAIHIASATRKLGVAGSKELIAVVNGGG